jgi:RNA polymerase sigma factor (sigma-70 family)
MSDPVITAFLRRLNEPAGYARATDRELLGRFLDHRDEAAFEVLFRRHERLVRAAVARVLPDPHDAADALQATFLVLIRRARAIDWRAGLGPWLYGVAHRVAVRLRDRNRRLPAPLGAADPAIHSPDPSWREACDLLHAELDRLPERYRLPLLLCYLEGHTRDEAATALGLSVGTVKGQVRRGCELLRRRLARRGVSLSAGLLAAATSRPLAAAPAAVAGLVDAPSPRVAELVREVTHAMTTTKLKLLPLALGLVALAGLTFALSLPDTSARPATVPAAPVPKPRPPVFLVTDTSVNVILDMDGKEIERFVRTTNGALSPDGAWLACIQSKTLRPGGDRIVILPRGHPGEPMTIPKNVPQLVGGIGVWSRDGRRLLFNETQAWRTEDGWESETKFWVYDVAANQVTDLKLPNVNSVNDWSLDGKRLLVDIPAKGQVVGRLAFVKADGTGEPEFITPEGELAWGARLSPDGKRILHLGCTPSWLVPYGERRLYMLDLVTKKRTVVDERGITDGFCWSPDGSRVAYTWQRAVENWADVAERETLLITCDPDGGNRKVVTRSKTHVEERYRPGLVYWFRVYDWR